MEEKTASAGTRAAGCLFCDAVRPFMEHLWSDATADHFRNSRVEFLKGLRSLLDARIAHLSREESKGTHVTVE